MDRIGDRGALQAFVRSVELAGFSAAARELRLSPSAVSKLVTRLERSLGVQLLHRTTRTLAPSPEGELFLARCRRILQEYEDAENEIGQSRERPRGPLRVHAGVGIAMHLLVPALPRFLQAYPQVEVDLLIEDRRVDVLYENVDLSIRPGPAGDESLVARTLFSFQRIVCAAPAYLRRHGTPRTPEELAAHRRMIVSSFPGRGNWRFTEGGRTRELDVSAGALQVNNADAVLQLALAGAGIVRLNEFIVADAIRSGALVPVLRPFHCADEEPILALFAHMRQRVPRVAAMLQFLSDSFGARPWRSAAPAAREP